MLLYDCPEEAMEARLLERGQTSGRTDDNLESIRKRFATFTAESLPVLQYYEQMGMVDRIDGSQPIEDVWAGSQAGRTAQPPTPTPKPYPSLTQALPKPYPSLTQALPQASPKPYPKPHPTLGTGPSH